MLYVTMYVFVGVSQRCRKAGVNRTYVSLIFIQIKFFSENFFLKMIERRLLIPDDIKSRRPRLPVTSLRQHEHRPTCISYLINC